MEDTLPIALRRTRRSSTAPTDERGPSPSKSPLKQQQRQLLSLSSASAHANPKTPRRSTKKIVRFSDPNTTSGLTPFIRRTTLLTTPQRRAASTPSRPCLLHPTSPSSFSTATNQELAVGEQAMSQPRLHQTIDGRIERRNRRSGLRDLLNKLDFQKRRDKQSAKEQIVQLKEDLKARDREIYELQNATIVIDTERIWDLEKQVRQLSGELDQKERDEKEYRRRVQVVDMDDAFVFGDDTARDFLCSTPSKSRSRGGGGGGGDSFPSPPATSPTVPTAPNTPERTNFYFEAPPLLNVSAGVQTSFRDEERDRWNEEMAGLNVEMEKLTGTLKKYEALGSYITEQASPIELGVKESLPSSAETLERKIKGLLQQASDGSAALRTIAQSLTGLGFPGSDTEEIIASLAAAFRTARLELEYLTPGEITLPLTSHGAEVLDLLLTKLRDFAVKAKADEACIDEYHELEMSLRKQLDARVEIMDELKVKVQKLESLLNDGKHKEDDLSVANERLKGAMDRYVRDVNELERLVEQLEREARDKDATINATKESHRRYALAKEDSIQELEAKLTAIVARSKDLEDQVTQLEQSHKQDLASLACTHEAQTSSLQDKQTSHIVKLNKSHGKALALRDARVFELRSEIERLGSSVKEAYERILKLGREKSLLEKDRKRLEMEKDQCQELLEEERLRGKEFVQSVVRLGGGLFEGKRRRDESQDGDLDELANGETSPISEEEEKSEEEEARLDSGEYLRGGLARKSGGNNHKRRRYDSGVGLMEDEESVEMF